MGELWGDDSSGKTAAVALWLTGCFAYNPSVAKQSAVREVGLQG